MLVMLAKNRQWLKWTGTQRNGTDSSFIGTQFPWLPERCSAVQSRISMTLLVPVTFGESDVRFLCSKVGSNFRNLTLAYRDYRDSRGTVTAAASLKTLMNCVATIPVSTAACERGFSKLNVICSSLRSRLTVPHISSLMFITLCGPLLRSWEPLKYVQSWLASNRRPADSTRCPERRIGNSSASEGIRSLWKVV